MKLVASDCFHPSSIRRLSLAAAVALVLGHHAEAATATWANTGTDFNTSANWNAGAGPVPTTADNATFSAGTPVQPDLSAPLTIQGLTFSTATGGWTLGSANSSLLTLTNTGTGVTSAINATNTTGTNTISAGIVLGGNAATLATITQTRGGTLVLSGPISSTNAITGVSLAAGTGTGNATFTLSGNNIYAGNTTITTNETVNLNSATAISAGTLIFNGSATIDNTSATAALVMTNNNNINLSGGSLTYTGTGGNSLSFGNGIATVSGANRTATISGGTMTIGSINADTTARTFTKAGAGTLVITNPAGANFQGGVLISAGILAVGVDSTPSTSGSTVTSGPLGTAPLTWSGAGALAASGGARTIANTIVFNNVSGTIAGSNDLTLNGAVTWGGSNTLTINNSGLTTFGGPTFTLRNGTGATPQAQRTLTLAGPGNVTISAPIVNGFSVNGIVAFTGSGTATFAGNNTHSGTTSVTAGTLKLGHANALGFGGVSVVAGATTIGSGGTIDLNGQTNVNELITLNGTGIGGNGNLINSNTSVPASIGSGVSGLAVTGSGSGYSTAPVVAINGTGTGAAAVAIMGLTPASFTLTPGDKVYSAAPTVTITGGGGQGAVATAMLSGGTTGTVVGINFGTDARGTGYTSTPTIAFSGGTVTSGTTDTTGVGNASNFTVTALQMTATGSGYAGGPPSVSIDSGASGAATATAVGSGLLLLGAIDNSIGGAGDIVVNGPINGTVGNPLTKVGPGTVTLAASNPYLGLTSVNGGTLLVNGSIAGSATTVNSGGKLGGNGGTLGSVTVNNLGTLAPGASIGTLSSGDVTLNAGSIFQLEINTTTPANDVLSITGALTLAATNDAILSIQDLGATAINSGTFTFLTYTGLWNNGLFTVGGNVIDDYDAATNPNSTAFIVSGNSYQLDYNAGGNSVALLAVPEPGSAVGLLGGLGLLLGRRRRRA